MLQNGSVCERSHQWHSASTNKTHPVNERVVSSCCSDFSSNEAGQVLFVLWSCWARPGDHRQTEGSKGHHPLCTSRRVPPSPVALWLARGLVSVTQYGPLKSTLKSVCSTTSLLLILLPLSPTLYSSYLPISPYYNSFTTSPTNLQIDPPPHSFTLPQRKTDAQHALAKSFFFFYLRSTFFTHFYFLCSFFST